MSAIARRYARACAEVVGGAGLDELAASLRALAGHVAKTPALREVAFNPAFRDRRDQVLAAVLAADGAPAPAARLVAVLAANGRLAALAQVGEALQALADQRARRRRVRVESATPLDEPARARLAAALGRQLGGEVVLDTAVVPGLIGGWICHIGAWTYDASVRRRLEQATYQLLGLTG